jgi:sulfonate transport system substrate-binding protein
MSEQAKTGRRGLLAAGAALALLAGGGWWWNNHQTTPDIGSQKLIVGDQRGGVQALLRAAGELDHVPYKIEWALFPAASPLLEALNSGAIDLGGIGGQPFAFAYAGGAKIKVVYAARSTTGKGTQASAIVVPANSPLRKLEDLKGKRLATIRGSAGQDLALQLLESRGLKPGDVQWVYLNNAEAKAALAHGSVDAWSTWGAYVGYALLQDKQRALADATQLPAGAGFFAASDKSINTKHAQIADFVQRLARARQWVASHREEYAAVLAKETGLPLDVASFAAGDSITQAVPVDDSLRSEQLAILGRYQRAGIIQKLPDLSGAFDSSFPIKP